MLKRRDFLRLSCALPAGVALSSLAGTAAAATNSERWRTFELCCHVHLPMSLRPDRQRPNSPRGTQP